MLLSQRADAPSILHNLAIVDHERQRRRTDPALGARVVVVKAYQQARFRHSYADLLDSPRYGDASRFFLDELYGTRDFSQRDAQFARIVPAVVRLFPHEIVQTVAMLGALHALSERLDSAMGAALTEASVDAVSYAQAWRLAAPPDDRAVQLKLMLGVGCSLDAYARRPVLRHSLRMMRGPARAAGLTELQEFLETGFEIFRAMHGALEFLAVIEQREQLLAQLLFEPAAVTTTSMPLPPILS